MKRALRQRLSAFVALNSTGVRTGLHLDQARDILDSDARLRKQVADLKARLKEADRLAMLIGWDGGESLRRITEEVANLKLKSWRKGGK